MRRKKIIGIVLAAVLVAAGLGSLAYAQATNPLLAFDQPFRCAHVGAGIDSVAYDTELSGHYSWNFHLGNNSEATVCAPTISVETSHSEWFPDVTFPVSWDWGPLGPGEKWLLIDALSSTDPITFTLGYDCSRTVEPLEIPPGGGVQTVTVKVKPVDEQRYTSKPGMRITVWGDVIPDSNEEPSEAVAEVDDYAIAWDFRWDEFKEYTFSVRLKVENLLDVNLLHKPRLEIFVESAEFLEDEETGPSTTIHDEILGEDITYSVAPDSWQWSRIIADCWLVEYMPLSRPLLEHQPMTGQKLVGQGGYVDILMPNGTIYDMGTSFTFTNPDCVSEITIDRISIFRFDGTVIYEGPLLRSGDGVIVETPWMEPMRPHETRIIRLDEMVPYAFPDWMEALESENEMNYTVEIFWTKSHKEGLPLTGWASAGIVKRDATTREVIDIITGSSTQMVNMEQKLKPKKVYEIGITQILDHPDLNATRQGFIDQMAKERFIEGVNVNYDFRNAGDDLTKAESIAQAFVSEKVDLILSITTPSSQACVEAAKGTGIPVVFAAVTDPVEAGIVSKWDAPRPDNVTGVSDMIDVKGQMKLIKEILREATVLGVIYNTDEFNSVVQIDQLKDCMADVGIEDIVEATVAIPDDVYAAAEFLVDSGCDAIWIPSDNTVVSRLEAVIAVGEDNDIPVFGSTGDMVDRGCIATLGVDYTWEGEQAGRYAAQILKGKFAGDIPVVKCSGRALVLVVNPAAAGRMGVTIPKPVLDRADRIVVEEP